MNISFEKVYSFKTHVIILLVSLLFSFFIVGYMHETNSSLMEEYVEENYGNNSEKYEDGHFVGYDEESLELLIDSLEKNNEETERLVSIITFIVISYIFSAFYFYYLLLKLNRDKTILIFLFLPLIMMAIMISYFAVVPLILYNIILLFIRDKEHINKKDLFKKIVVVYAIIYIVVALVFYLNFSPFFKKRPEITLSDDLNVCVNEVVTDKDFILDVTNGELIINEEEIDTSSEGKRVVPFDVKDKYGKINHYHYIITIRDCE